MREARWYAINTKESIEFSAIILAGGLSSRFGMNKGLVPLLDKPLIRYVLDVVYDIVDEVIVVVSSKNQVKDFMNIVSSDSDIVVDAENTHSPLVGASSGFEEACGRYSLLLPCDTPLVSKDVLLFLLELRTNKNAVVIRWPNGYIEPLQAVYCTKPAVEAAKNALVSGKSDMLSIINGLQGVRYVSTLALLHLDPELRTLLNINSPQDLKAAEDVLEHARKQRK